MIKRQIKTLSWNEEKSIVKVMMSYLKSRGYIDLKEFKKEKMHGVDIDAKHPKTNKRWLIECKGYPSEKYVKGKKTGEKSSQTINSQRYSWITKAIGQISLRMKKEDWNYGIALPYNKYYINKVIDRNKENVPKYKRTYMSIFRKRAKVYFFFINKEQIFQIAPNSNKRKELT